MLKNKSKKKNLENEEDVQRLMNSISDSDLSVSPYMKTRVLALVKDRKRKRLFPPMAISLASIYLLVFLGLNGNFSKTESPADVFPIHVNHLAVVRYSLEDYSKAVYLKVQLDEGVSFYSRTKEIESKSVSLNLKKMRESEEYLSIVIKAHEIGEKKINFMFYDEKKNLIKSEFQRINFVKS